MTHDTLPIVSYIHLVWASALGTKYIGTFVDILIFIFHWWYMLSRTSNWYCLLQWEIKYGSLAFFLQLSLSHTKIRKFSINWILVSQNDTIWLWKSFSYPVPCIVLFLLSVLPVMWFYTSVLLLLEYFCIFFNFFEFHISLVFLWNCYFQYTQLCH